MRIYVDVKNIPEIKISYQCRTNKKDSFDRWLRKTSPVIVFRGFKWVDISNEH